MSKLSNIEIYLKTIGFTVLLIGSGTFIYTVLLLFKDLPASKYGMVAGISISVLLLYIGYILSSFKQRDTGYMIYEHEII